MSAVQLRLPAGMWRALREIAGGSPTAAVVTAVIETDRHGAPEELLAFPGPIMVGTADVPAVYVRWVAAVAPLYNATVDEAWRNIIAAFLSRHASPGLEHDRRAA